LETTSLSEMPTLLISWNTKKRLPLVLLIAAALLGKGKEDTDDFELGIGAYSNNLAAAAEALLTKAPTSAPTAPCNTIDCFYNSTFAFPMFSVSHDISNSGNGGGGSGSGSGSGTGNGGGSGSKEEDSGVGDRGRPMHPCLELSMEAVTEAVGLSNGSKELYFEALRNLTGTSLTAKPFTHSGTRLTTTVDSSSVESDSGFRSIDDSSSSGGSSGSSSNVLFVGDSIVNELLSSYRRITTTATAHSTTTTAASVLSMLRATPLHGNAEKTKLMVLEKLLAMANPPQDHNDNNNRNKKSRSSNSGGEDSGSTTNSNMGGNRNMGGGGTTFDMVIAGGLGLWHLADMPCVSDPNSPTALHRKIVHEHLLVYQALSAELGIPFVFVGSVPVDSAVVLLSPAKHDWHSFHDFR
jgi:hypothetical protein